ncbi:uncharacterized protein TRIREDRAFT_106564, partial [Trichoderma reesei QM6a]
DQANNGSDDGYCSRDLGFVYGILTWRVVEALLRGRDAWREARYAAVEQSSFTSSNGAAQNLTSQLRCSFTCYKATQVQLQQGPTMITANAIKATLV